MEGRTSCSTRAGKGRRGEGGASTYPTLPRPADELRLMRAGRAKPAKPRRRLGVSVTSAGRGPTPRLRTTDTTKNIYPPIFKFFGKKKLGEIFFK